MTSRRVKAVKRLLQSLDGPAPLNNNKGPIVITHAHLTKKDKRHDGVVTPRWTPRPGMKYKYAIQEALEPQEYFDAWKSWSDGLHYNKDRSMLRSRYIWSYDYLEVEKYNKKIKKLELRRQARKHSKQKAKMFLN